MLKKLIWLAILVAVAVSTVKGVIHTRYIMLSNNYTNQWKQKSLDNGVYIYLALGDSRALGIGATTPADSYVGILSDRIYKTTGSFVKTINLSSNKGIDDVIERQIPIISEHQPEIITISVGSQEVADGKREEEIIFKIQQLFERLPLEEIYFAEIPAFYDNKKNQAAQNINLKIHEFAETKGVKVIPLYNATKKASQDITFYDLDLSHPNDKGYAIWADTFWDSIQ